MMIRTVGGWVFLLVPAHPGSPGQKAVKRLLLLLFLPLYRLHCCAISYGNIKVFTGWTKVFRRGHRLTFCFCPNFMPKCPLQRNASSLYPIRKKTLTFLAAILRPFGPGAKILTREVSVRPTYCQILSGSVKVCGSSSRKADFEQIPTGITHMHDSVQ